MNGIHDLGGMQGFGPVSDEPNEPAFHAPWEGRVLALQRAILFTRTWNLDEFRYSQECLPASEYLSVSYYHRWVLGLTRSAVEHGLVTERELETGRGEEAPRSVERTMAMADVEAATVRPSFFRPQQQAPRFKTGDRVRTRNIHPTGHTRLPRYARDKEGWVESVHGCHAYPDAIVAGDLAASAWLYTVVFDGRQLWGDDADPQLSVSVEAFEPYLRHV